MKRRTLIAVLAMVTALLMTACSNTNSQLEMHNAQLEDTNAQGVIDNADTNSQGEISNSQSGKTDSDDNSELSIPNSELNTDSDSNSELSPSNSELKDDSELEAPASIDNPKVTGSPKNTEAPDDNAQSEIRNEEGTNEEGDINAKGDTNEESEISNAESGNNDSTPNYELSTTPLPSIPNYELDTDSELPVATATPAPTAAPKPTEIPKYEYDPDAECLHSGTTEYIGATDWETTYNGACYDTFCYAIWKCSACGLTYRNGYIHSYDESYHNQHKKGTDIPATCTTDGYAYGWTCDCGAKDTDDSVVKARGHRVEIYQIGSRYIDTTVSGGDANGYTEWHYEERCAINGCSHVVRDWWSTDPSEAW